MSRHTRLGSFAVIVGLAMMLSLVLEVGSSQAAGAAAKTQAEQILSRIEVDRGICVLLASEPSELAVALAERYEEIFAVVGWIFGWNLIKPGNRNQENK